MRPSLRLTRLAMVLGLCFALIAHAPAQTLTSSETIDRRVWSLHYWQKLAERGLVEVAKPTTFAPSEQATRMAISPLDSRDMPVSPLTNITQSENSIFIHPNEINSILNSNNSTSWPVSNLFGTSGFMSDDGGVTWRGGPEGTGGSNSGDPAAVIDRNGRYFVGYIAANDGQGVARSLNRGQTWTHVQAATARGANLLDKNHLWVDNRSTSPFVGNLYSAWTMFGGPNDAEIEIVRSTDGGLNWSTPLVISRNANAGSHNQGVHIQTGPNGEVYVMWAIYDSFPADETALGFALSRDGGATFEPARRILTNIRGIRSSGASKGIRVVSFPVMAADISNAPRRGTLYAVWTNRGVPGVNTGNDIDGYLIKSTDNGATWSSPVRINQDATGLGKQHFFHWITCDPANGNVSVIFYDDRNVAATQCETFVANSTDGGATWSDFRVSDVSFRPAPIPGLAAGYFGDYLGIAALGGKVYPCWTDNRDGRAMTYVSPFILEQDSIPPSPVTDLSASAPTSNSITLQWTAHGDDADSGRATSYDIRYALAPIDSASFLTATRVANNLVPQLPGAREFFEVRGLNFNTTYFFAVKVIDEQDNASPVSNSPSATTLGAPRIAVNPGSLADSLLTGAKVIKTLTVSNVREGTLDFRARATVSWLALVPDSGRVFAGAALDLQTAFDATGLDGGADEGEIILTSNDSTRATTRVPVRLFVIGAPDIALPDTALDFGTVFVTDTLTHALVIFNLGTDTLKTNITVSSPFAVPKNVLTLAPRTSDTLLVSFIPTTLGSFVEVLSFTSNDPDEPIVIVSLRGASAPPPEIGIAPSRLDESLFVGQTRQQTLTITNSGESDLTFTLEFENAQLPRAFFKQNIKKQTHALGEELIDAKAHARLRRELIKRARAATAGIEFPAHVADDAEGLAPDMRARFQEQVKPYAELVKRVHATAALPRLAVAGFNSASLLSVLLRLSNSVLDYAYADVGDNFTLATLEGFDGVIVDERDFRLTLTEAQALRDFASSGRGVFIGMDDFDNLTPEVQSVVYPLFGVSAAFDGDFVFGAFNPNHPITQDLTTMERFNSVDNDYFTLAGADWIFSNPSNDYYGVAYQTRTRTLLFGESLFAIVLNLPNNLLLLSNAIDWMVAGNTGWVTLDKTSGTLAPETSENILVTFSAAGLRGGEYTADLAVRSNDPDEKRTIIPVHLIVTDAPDIAVVGDTLDFGEVFVGVEDSLLASVRNDGTLALLITSAEAAPEIFKVTPASANIAPGTRANFKVSFTPAGVGDFSGTLRLANNDPDENPTIITLLGKGVAPPVIAVAPDSFTFALNSGDSASATMTIANNGGSVLNFTLRDVEGGAGGVAVGERYVFWTQEFTNGPDTLFRANLDGTNIRPIYVGNLNAGYASIAYHPGEGRIYSGEFSEGRIFSVKVDGSEPRVLVTGLGAPFDIVLDLSAGHMYWTEFQSGVIKRANLDGTGVSVVVQSALPGGELSPAATARASKPLFNETGAALLNAPWSLDLDLRARKIYWSERSANLVSRANLDGTGKEVISSSISFPSGLKLDVSQGKIYFVEVGTGQIKRMDLNGANQELLVQNASTAIGDFKLDLAAQKIYWTDFNADQVLRANFDGSEIAPVIARPALSSDGPFSLGLATGSEWLAENPAQGTVAAGASLPIELKVRSKGLLGGDYRATVFINSNDPFASEKQVPVTLKVTGVPLVAARPDTLRFGEVFVAQTGKASVTVTNTGTANLLVANVQTTLTTFAYFDSTQFTLAPGTQRELRVFFTPNAVQSYAAELIFATNDVKQPQVRIALLGEGIPAPVIAAAPDSLCDSLKTGGTSTRTLTISNFGGSPLAWSGAVDFSSASRVMSESPRFVSSSVAAANKRAAAPPPLRREDTFVFPIIRENRFAGKREIDQSNAFAQPLDSTRVKLNRNFAQVNGAIPNRFDFVEGEVGSSINDGGNDMYDGGNILATNLGASLSYSNNVIVNSPLFGASGRYFTRKYPGLFILAAEMQGVSTFTINGNLGADGAGNVDGAILETTLSGQDYQGFVKRVFNAGDPSVNHLIIIAKSAGATHEFLTNTDSDFHRVSNLNATTRLYYLLYAGANGGYIDNAATLNLMNAFLAALELLPDWLTLNPASGVIPPNSSQEVQARFDATGLSGGNYRAKIALTSNDPLTPLLQVPACLNVTGAALIRLADSTLAFGDVFVGEGKTQSFSVLNPGTDTLRVSAIFAGTNVFSATPASFKLAPSQEQKVLARFAPVALGAFLDVLTITSNAENAAQVVLPVSGNGVATPIIAVAPDSIAFVLEEDQTATQTVTLRNNGGSVLTFSLRDEEQSAAPAAGANKKLYWSNLGTTRTPSQILRSDLDGSDLETLVTATGATMRGIAIDEQHARLYWCDSFQRGIFSSTLTGDSVRALVSNLSLPIDIALDVEQNKMYWTDFSAGTIGRANLDGSEATVLIAGAAQPHANVDEETESANIATPNSNAALNAPFGLTLDLRHRKIYWTETTGNRIGRANLDGSNIETVLTSPNTNGPRGVRLDEASGKIYFLDTGSDRIKRADFNGGNVETLATLSASAFLELLELDLVAGKMYWSDFGLDNIASANLDGGNLRVIHTAPNAFDSYGVALLNAGWLSETPLSGTIAAGQSASIAFNANAQGLAPGDYRATVFVNSNDPVTSVKDVPVNLRVRASGVLLALADTTSGVPRDTVDVPVRLDFGTPHVLRTLQAPLKLSNQNLQFFAYTPGPIVPRGLRVQAPASDSVSITFASEGGQYLHQSGLLTTLHFRVANNAAPGAVTELRFLNLTATDSAGGAPKVRGSNGLFFTTKAPEVSGNVRYALANGGGNSAKPVAELSAVLSRNAAIVQTQSTNNSGNYALRDILPRTNYRVEVRRQSGGLRAAVSPTDALLTFNAFLGNLTLSGAQNLAADVDGNLAISREDALAIFNRFLGVTREFPVADWRAFPASYAIDGSATAWKTAPTGIAYPVLDRDQLNQDYVALARGDVDLSWTASTNAATLVAELQGNEANANAVAFRLATARSVAGTDRIILPLQLGGGNMERGVYAFGGELQYSNEQLEIVAVHWGELVPQQEFRASHALSKASSSTEAASAESSEKLTGRLRFGGFASAATAIRRGGVLLEVEARVLGNLPAGASLSVQLRETSAALGASSASLQAGASYVAAHVTVEQSTDLVLAAPATFALLNNYPNPFNPTTELRYQLPEPATVSLTIFNALGQKVRTLVDAEKQVGGYYRLTWDAKNEAREAVAQGVYFYYLQAQGASAKFQQTKKMLLVK